jgi:hypothetical protein
MMRNQDAHQKLLADQAWKTLYWHLLPIKSRKRWKQPYDEQPVGAEARFANLASGKSALAMPVEF